MREKEEKNLPSKPENVRIQQIKFRDRVGLGFMQHPKAHFD